MNLPIIPYCVNGLHLDPAKYRKRPVRLDVNKSFKEEAVDLRIEKLIEKFDVNLEEETEDEKNDRTAAGIFCISDFHKPVDGIEISKMDDCIKYLEKNVCVNIEPVRTLMEKILPIVSEEACIAVSLNADSLSALYFDVITKTDIYSRKLPFATNVERYVKLFKEKLYDVINKDTAFATNMILLKHYNKMIRREYLEGLYPDNIVKNLRAISFGNNAAIPSPVTWYSASFSATHINILKPLIRVILMVNDLADEDKFIDWCSNKAETEDATIMKDFYWYLCRNIRDGSIIKGEDLHLNHHFAICKQISGLYNKGRGKYSAKSSTYSTGNTYSSNPYDKEKGRHKYDKKDEGGKSTGSKDYKKEDKTGHTPSDGAHTSKREGHDGGKGHKGSSNNFYRTDDPKKNRRHKGKGKSKRESTPAGAKIIP